MTLLHRIIIQRLEHLIYFNEQKGLIDERFKSAVDTSRILGQAEAYGKLTNQNP